MSSGEEIVSTLRVIFVCSGNICRSPLAEVMAKHMFAQREISSVVISMGTLGIHGRPAASNSVRAAAEIDLDLEGHRSQGIQAGLLEVADWLVVMEKKHARALLDVNGQLADKIVRLWEHVDEELDGIPDPVGQDIEAFRTARERIESGLENWMEQLGSSD
jgi:protein-tyrosine phosphatase